MRHSRIDTMKQQSASNETEEDTAPNIAALAGMIVIGLLYAALPQNLIIGPNWLLLVLEAVFIVPLLISIATKGGGPWKRHLSGHQAADFLFPQQVSGNSWVPHFLDYLFLAFTGATALSPADTFPLSRLAKALMMIEAILSLTVVTVLAARAVNILGS